MRRQSFRIPARDCIDVPASCPHQPNCGGHYGRHGEEWRYTSISNDGLTALSLEVFTDIFPEGSTIAGCDDDKPLNERRHGADLSLCATFPVDLENIRAGTPGGYCPYLGTCYRVWTTALGAHDFFLKHGSPAQSEQSESFWKSLEARHRELGEVARGRRTDITHKQCGACGGAGTVKK